MTKDAVFAGVAMRILSDMGFKFSASYSGFILASNALENTFFFVLIVYHMVTSTVGEIMCIKVQL